MRKRLKGLKHPSLPQAIKGGTIVFGIAVVIAGIITLYDLGVTSLLGLFL